VTSMSDAGEFLQVISSSSNLNSLAIDTSIIPRPEELCTFLTGVSQSGLRDTLTTVILRDDEEVDEEAPPAYFLDALTLSPLLQFPNLEKISIGIHYGYGPINNSLMNDMAFAWPNLREIILDSPYARSWHCSVDLEGLVHLAQHCHALELVSLSFNVSLPTPSAQFGYGIRYESLTRLDVDHSHIKDPPAVATLLSDVFPNLTLDHGWKPSEASWDDSEDESEPEFIAMCQSWAEVDRLLEIRKHKRL
jgi:hypothetical protein